MGYLRLSGTNWSRSALFGACRETAKLTSKVSLRRSMAGTTPEVLSVTRRLPRP